MTIVLPDLPYPASALQPYLSEETLQIHHGRHHAAYVRKTNELLQDKSGAGRDLRDILLTAYREGDTALFRNSAQAWNHEHYWQSMRPSGGGSPSGELAGEIEREYGTFDAFRTAFTRKAMELFGSGWVWLVVENGNLGVMSTKDATNPLCYGATPLLTLDVWEHAYYIDYRNERQRHVDAFLDHLADWDFAARNFSESCGHGLMPVDRWKRR